MKTSSTSSSPYGCALSRLKEIASRLQLSQHGMIYQTTLSLLEEHRRYVSKRRICSTLSYEDQIASFLGIVNNIIPIALGDYYEDALP